MTCFWEKVREEREALQPEVKEKKDVAFKETITDDNKPPTVRHTRVTSAPPLKPLRIAVEANDPSGVKWVRLRYRSVNQHQDYKTLEMKSKGSGAYEAIVPGEDIASEWDFMYLIEAMDAKGNGTIWPDFEEQAPYVVVRLER